MYLISICLISYNFLLIISMIFMMMSVLFIYNDYLVFIEWEILSVNSNSIVMSMLLDWMSLLFMSFVMFISCMVIYYSYDYMSNELNMNRFIYLVLLFVLSMLFMIISPNLISILLGWDGLGLVSYCLVIYYQNIKSYNSGMLTILMNRIGDVGILMAIVWMMNYGSWNFIFYLNLLTNNMYFMIISVMVILSAMTKSAQIPFSSWLPAAMAAPTPVSALVHSSTLVTAGVYLLIRFNYLIEGWFKMFLLLISVLTMFMAGLGANYEYDLKKIIALSTLSQLGLMMSIICIGNFKLAFFHLLTHALFKALLFMCAGNIIHNFKNNQDIRYMGNMIIYMPLTCICMSISLLALSGMPFLSGFYSKDLILDYFMMGNMNYLIFILFFVSMGLTVSYSYRLIYYLVMSKFSFYSLYMLRDENWKMLYSMLMMIIMVLIMGSMLSWMIFPSPIMICLPWYFKNMIIFMSIIGVWLGYEMSLCNLNLLLNMMNLNSLSMFNGCMWFMPSIFTMGVNYFPLFLGFSIYKSIDQGWNEFIGGQGLFYKLKYNSIIMQFFQNNNMKIYFLLIFFWLMVIMLMI
uniref:NADH-ubiquinone oxidoreductase chain 5 n=1 Tax=Omoglymmius wukong TaxID=2983420 RepID=A0A977TLH6_9CARA|nr:NADH dehydrogenase subunit 5 [Omoglymmius wukong]UXW93693.1 NADH dehydrogenase subunit 5 [Omoglymmius wukong]